MPSPLLTQTAAALDRSPSDRRLGARRQSDLHGWDRVLGEGIVLAEAHEVDR